jgi:hypothetical protein
MNNTFDLKSVARTLEHSSSELFACIDSFTTWFATHKRRAIKNDTYVDCVEELAAQLSALNSGVDRNMDVAEQAYDRATCLQQEYKLPEIRILRESETGMGIHVVFA